MTTELLLISTTIIAASGFPSLLFPRRSIIGQWIAAIFNVIGSGLGFAALTLIYLRPGSSAPISLPWNLPVGRFAIDVDGISLIFLIPVFLISALGSIYGLGYWPQNRHPRNARKLAICWGLLAGSMAMVVLSRDGLLLLISWEIMALAAYFLVATEDKSAAREAGWIYLVAAHLGTLCLFGFFALLHRATGSFDLWPTSLALSPVMCIAIFFLGAIGFGLKTGVMPLHIWLPGAHANAPSHVSAILSGVLLNIGVYGLVRITALMPHPPIWWGATFLVLGALSAIFGIVFAVAQTDFKRLLAYSSIENIGIVILGIGLATLGRSLDRPEWIVLGMAAALFHVLNHSLMKPLLFMGAGAVVHATGTREMDLLGGLGKQMPKTFILFVIGATAICGLPPLNGFVGEILLYIGLLQPLLDRSNDPNHWAWIGLAAPALALAGALAVTAFVKLIGIVFSGNPRSSHAEKAHDPDRKMLCPMWLLGGSCVVIGAMPFLAINLLDRGVAAWSQDSTVPIESISSYVPIGWLTAMSLALIALIAAGAFWLRRLPAAGIRTVDTWGCGYLGKSARVQYTGSSFSQMIVECFSWMLLPRRTLPRIDRIFAGPSKFSSEIPDVVLDRAVLPAIGSAGRSMKFARVLQRGPIQLYLLYILVILIVLLLFF